MYKPTLAYTMLAIFTPPERAREIEGDLLEEMHTHGKPWFYTQVLCITARLFLYGVSRRPFDTVLLGIAGLLPVALVYCFVPDLLINRIAGLNLFSIAAWQFAATALAAYCTGYVVTTTLPERGTRVLGCTILLSLGLLFWHFTDLILFYLECGGQLGIILPYVVFSFSFQAMSLLVPPLLGSMRAHLTRLGRFHRMA